MGLLKGLAANEKKAEADDVPGYAALARTGKVARHYNPAMENPLITLHTTRDQQVPFQHEALYALKTATWGNFITRHLPVVIDRFEHCNFTPDEVLASFAIMLFYDGAVQEVSGVGAFLTADQAARFETLARAVGLPSRRDGAALAMKLRSPQ